MFNLILFVLVLIVGILIGYLSSSIATLKLRGNHLQALIDHQDALRRLIIAYHDSSMKSKLISDLVQFLPDDMPPQKIVELSTLWQEYNENLAEDNLDENIEESDDELPG